MKEYKIFGCFLIGSLLIVGAITGVAEYLNSGEEELIGISVAIVPHDYNTSITTDQGIVVTMNGHPPLKLGAPVYLEGSYCKTLDHRCHWVKGYCR